jgi:hypothetical protein
MIYYSLGVAVLILGLICGSAVSCRSSACQVVRVGLFWVSVAGLLGVVATVAAIIGISAVFDERTDFVNAFDHLFAVSRHIVLLCMGLAVAGHAIVFLGSKQKSTQDAEQIPAGDRLGAAPEE